MPANDVTRSEVRIPATDGFPLSATITSSGAGAGDWVIINGAFAVASRFYASFAGAAPRPHGTSSWSATRWAGSFPDS